MVHESRCQRISFGQLSWKQRKVSVVLCFSMSWAAGLLGPREPVDGASPQAPMLGVQEIGTASLVGSVVGPRCSRSVFFPRFFSFFFFFFFLFFFLAISNGFKASPTFLRDRACQTWAPLSPLFRGLEPRSRESARQRCPKSNSCPYSTLVKVLASPPGTV